jgi:hypothetical protein
MKSPFYRLLSCFIIVSFLFYWVLSTAMSVSLTTKENKLARTFPRFNRFFGHTWSLFVQSFDYDDRLYLVLRDKNTKVITDSLELLKDISYQKIQHAPFNQREYIVDRLVSHYATIIKHKTVEYRNYIKKDFPNATDSFYNARLIDLEYKDALFNESLGTIDNFCKVTLAEKNIDTTNKEFKIIIKEKRVKPFDERKNDKFVMNEIIYFESAYKPFEK